MGAVKSSKTLAARRTKTAPTPIPAASGRNANNSHWPRAAYDVLGDFFEHTTAYPSRAQKATLARTVARLPGCSGFGVAHAQKYFKHKRKDAHRREARGPGVPRRRRQTRVVVEEEEGEEEEERGAEEEELGDDVEMEMDAFESELSSLTSDDDTLSEPDGEGEGRDSDQSAYEGSTGPSGSSSSTSSSSVAFNFSPCPVRLALAIAEEDEHEARWLSAAPPRTFHEFGAWIQREYGELNAAVLKMLT
ncbi:uncharacterized protein BXZ73DRAFT_99884 [Epithele typhae]|uniref:uncharacterized protein n=1 Tax=Epithele typhae TaxID=378194 RepID=UPI002007430E|nr:uncharacterized protein BXZ73DRAFT_99884 [Epithele typhae]KAH9938823.1 hypothetical protein BXZ73DRAFT_99884 [Epithele typhae]